jgi:hypothetical protein
MLSELLFTGGCVTWKRFRNTAPKETAALHSPATRGREDSLPLRPGFH